MMMQLLKGFVENQTVEKSTSKTRRLVKGFETENLILNMQILEQMPHADAHISGYLLRTSDNLKESI